MHTTHSNTQYKNESKHSEMGPVRQNPIQRTVICVCIALCTIVAHNIAQNRPDSFPPYPPDNHHSSDDVYLREGGYQPWQSTAKNKSLPLKTTHVVVILSTQSHTHTVVHSSLPSDSPSELRSRDHHSKQTPEHHKTVYTCGHPVNHVTNITQTTIHQYSRTIFFLKIPVQLRPWQQLAGDQCGSCSGAGRLVHTALPEATFLEEATATVPRLIPFGSDTEQSSVTVQTFTFT